MSAQANRKGTRIKACWLAAVLGALGAQNVMASLVQFDMRGQVAVASGTLTNVSEGTEFFTSFLLDTSAFDQLELSSATFSNPNFMTLGPVVDAFAVTGARFASVQASLGGYVFTASEAKGSYDGALSSPGNGDDYDLSLSILALPDFSLSFRDFNTTQRGGFNLDEITADPLIALALGFDRVPAFSFLTGNFGHYGINVSTLTASQVPEPAVLSLFLSSVCLMWLMNASRSRRRKLAPSDHKF